MQLQAYTRYSLNLLYFTPTYYIHPKPLDWFHFSIRIALLLNSSVAMPACVTASLWRCRRGLDWGHSTPFLTELLSQEWVTRWSTICDSLPLHTLPWRSPCLTFKPPNEAPGRSLNSLVLGSACGAHLNEKLLKCQLYACLWPLWKFKELTPQPSSLRSCSAVDICFSALRTHLTLDCHHSNDKTLSLL